MRRRQADMLRIIQLSDLHFGTVKKQVELALITAIRQLQPDIIVISGDITQRARASQFKAARRNLIQALHPTPILAVPGNHDIPLFNVFARFLTPYYGFQKHFYPNLEEGLVINQTAIATFNATSKYRHVNGQLDLIKVKHRLAQLPAGTHFKLAVLHHPLDCRRLEDEVNLLENRRQFAVLLSELQFDLVIGGHIHDPWVNLSDQRYPSLPRNFIIAVAGTAASARTRNGIPNSFYEYLIEEGGNGLTLLRHDFSPDRGFVPTARHTFKRAEQWQRLAIETA